MSSLKKKRFAHQYITGLLIIIPHFLQNQNAWVTLTMYLTQSSFFLLCSERNTPSAGCLMFNCCDFYFHDSVSVIVISFETHCRCLILPRTVYIHLSNHDNLMRFTLLENGAGSIPIPNTFGYWY